MGDKDEDFWKKLEEAKKFKDFTGSKSYRNYLIIVPLILAAIIMLAASGNIPFID